MTEEDILKILDKTEGIVVADGLKYCGSLPAYIKFLNSYRGSIESKSADIENAFESGDYDTYTSKAHQLKSSSRIIGAQPLSELAEKLEAAGKTGDIDFIRENHESFLQLFKSYYQSLSVLTKINAPSKPGRKEIPREELEEAYQALSENISMMDYDAVETILSSLKEYSLSDPDEALVELLCKHLNNMRWDEMEKAILNRKL